MSTGVGFSRVCPKLQSKTGERVFSLPPSPDSRVNLNSHNCTFEHVHLKPKKNPLKPSFCRLFITTLISVNLADTLHIYVYHKFLLTKQLTFAVPSTKIVIVLLPLIVVTSRSAEFHTHNKYRIWLARLCTNEPLNWVRTSRTDSWHTTEQYYYSSLISHVYLSCTFSSSRLRFCLKKNEN